MAKWGEGDPRWIVEERPDATNVNNWHWTEKNAQNWSKEKLRNLLLNFTIVTSVGECTISEIDKLEGDATASNRKGKIIVFYEWELKLNFKGKVYGIDNELTGSIKIPNLSDENDMDDLDFQISSGGKTADDERLKEALRNEGVKLLKVQIQNYVDTLKAEFTQGMILPKKEGDGSNNTLVDPTVSKMSSGFDKCSINKTPSSGGGESNTKYQTLTLSTSMKCKAEELYSALLNEHEFRIFTNGSGTIDGKVGGKFEMFGGNVHGVILELEPNKKIVQHWKFKTWKEFSKVTIRIEQKTTSTTVFVTQTGVPEGDYDKTKEGWDRYYFDAMKRTLGFGTFIQ